MWVAPDDVFDGRRYYIGWRAQSRPSPSLPCRELKRELPKGLQRHGVVAILLIIPFASVVNREDYIELIGLLEEGLRDALIADVTDPSLHLERDSESGALRPQSHRDHLLELLSALDRYLAVSDRRTYFRAVQSITEVVEEQPVLDAVVMSLEAGATEPRSLGNMPDLGAIRSQIAELIEQIEADPEVERETYS